MNSVYLEMPLLKFLRLYPEHAFRLWQDEPNLQKMINDSNYVCRYCTDKGVVAIEIGYKDDEWVIK